MGQEWLKHIIILESSKKRKKVSSPGEGLENVWKLERFHILIPSFQTMGSLSIIMSNVSSDKQAWPADVQ